LRCIVSSPSLTPVRSAGPSPACLDNPIVKGILGSVSADHERVKEFVLNSLDAELVRVKENKALLDAELAYHKRLEIMGKTRVTATPPTPFLVPQISNIPSLQLNATTASFTPQMVPQYSNTPSLQLNATPVSCCTPSMVPISPDFLCLPMQMQPNVNPYSQIQCGGYQQPFQIGAAALSNHANNQSEKPNREPNPKYNAHSKNYAFACNENPNAAYSTTQRFG